MTTGGANFAQKTTLKIEMYFTQTITGKKLLKNKRSVKLYQGQ